MLITLYGPDSYRRLSKLKEIVDAYNSKEGNLSRERFDLREKDSLDKLKGFLGSQSIFSPKKLAILDEPFESTHTKELKELLKEQVESSDTTVLINTTKKQSAPFKFLEEKPNKFEEFASLKSTELTKFIKKEAEKAGLSLSTSEISNIATAAGGADTWRIVTELEQMVLTKRAQTASKGQETQPDYFPSINALKRGRSVGDRLSGLEKLLSARRDDPAKVFNMLAFQLGSAKEAQMYADYDVAIKAGKLEYEEVLLAIALGLEFNPLD